MCGISQSTDTTSGQVTAVDDPKLAILGQFTPEGKLTPGYGDVIQLYVGYDDVHGALVYLINAEKRGHYFNQYGYDDEEINTAIMAQIENKNIFVQGTLDESQAGGVHEKQILASDFAKDSAGFNSHMAIGKSSTGQISHTKGGVLQGLGISYGGSTNWSKSGEGIGISLKPGKQPAGFVAQNNTLTITTNAQLLLGFITELTREHHAALANGKKLGV